MNTIRGILDEIVEDQVPQSPVTRQAQIGQEILKLIPKIEGYIEGSIYDPNTLKKLQALAQELIQFDQIAA